MIKLTQMYDNVPVWINPTHIVGIEAHEEFTEIFCLGWAWKVSEGVAEVFKLLREKH